MKILFIIFFLFFLFSYIKASKNNIRLVKVKPSKLEYCKMFLLGPWYTIEIIEDELHKVTKLFQKLRRKIWFNHNKKIRSIVNELENESLSTRELFLFREHILRKIRDERAFLNGITSFMSWIIAAFIGFGAASAQVNYPENSYSFDAGLYGAIIVVVVYFLLIAHLSRAISKTETILQGLNIYENKS